jgi:hypothetical protein
MLNAEPYQTQLENSQEMFVPRSVAASYLCKYIYLKRNLFIISFV